jgi:SAM-dependent methyltransferase
VATSETGNIVQRVARGLAGRLRVHPVTGPLGRRVTRAARAFWADPAMPEGSRRAGAAGVRRYPPHYRLPDPPAPITGPWPDPPPIDEPIALATASSPEAAPTRYDLALFEQLNDEYAGSGLAANAPSYDGDSLDERSRGRLDNIHQRIGLAGMAALEVGCGAGYEVWHLAHRYGCDAWGIDTDPRKGWSALAGPRVHLIEGDMAAATALPSTHFDRVVSFTVWEHVRRPVEAIAELHRVMKPGALAVIRANLYRGPTASHLAREIHFPFPHLLFQDDVIAEALGRAGHEARGAVWVNRLTWEQYEAAFLAAGFVIRSLSFTHYPLDEAFHARFEDVLGRYPRQDLERGFFQVTLEKPIR